MRIYSFTFPDIENENTFLDLVDSVLTTRSLAGAMACKFDVERRCRVLTFEYHTDADNFLTMVQECEEELLFTNTFTIRLEKQT